MIKFQGTYKDEFTGNVCNRDGYAFNNITRNRTQVNIMFYLFTHG